MSSPTPSSSPFRQSLAVVIGINQYTHGVPVLRSAVNDARRVADILSTRHGYETIRLLDEEATHEALVTLFKVTLPARVGPDDRVCFYFAGHGKALDGDQGPNGYLLPQDARLGDESTYLSMPLVHDALLTLTCRHMLVILDSCFSGAFRWSGTRTVVGLPDVIHQERYDRFVHDPAWQVITSASQDQTALDQLSTGTLGSRDVEGAHSPFAMALFRGLEGAGDVVPSAGGDGVITATELYLFIEEQLQTATIEARARQTPRLWPLSKHEKGEFIFLTPGRDVVLPPAPPLTFEANPWRGLAAYERTDADLFFGREDATAALDAAIATHAFVAVLGASGTGKSSLLKAGILPRLERNAAWAILPVVRPGTTPLDALARSVSTLAPGRPSSDGEGIVAATAAWCGANPGRRLLLIIDQCEELVTMARAAVARDAVMQLLACLLEAHPGQVRVVVTLRTDFEPQFDRSALGPWWAHGRFVVPLLTRGDLKAVIEQPASKRVLYFDPPALVEALVDEVVNTPGGLPLLSFALSEMYIRYVTRQATQSTDRALTRADYDGVGGVVGALRSRADAEYDALDEPHRGSMQRLMLRMVGGGPGSLAKRRVTDTELDFPDPSETARVQAVLRRLTGARLVVEGKESDGESYAEPAHDALVRAWGRLIGWIHQTSADAVPLVTRQKLAVASLEWARAANRAAKSGLLWSDSVRSGMLSPVVRAKAPWLNRQEMAFAQRSVRGRRNARWAAMAVTLLIAALGVASVNFGFSARRNGEEARVRGEQARLRGEEAVAAAARAEAEKVRAVRSLFSSLRLFMRTGNAGSVCVRPACAGAPPSDGHDWISISRLPEEVPSDADPAGSEESRDFIAAREYGAGHVLVYAQDGLTRDDEIRGKGRDNLVFAENALRWLAGSAGGPGCPTGTTILFWEGTFVPARAMASVKAIIASRGWSLAVASPDRLQDDLRCAAVLWYVSDWEPPPGFATTHVPLIERFVRAGGGLLVGGLGWSYADQGAQILGLAPGGALPPYAANQLGGPFGFAFTADAFRADPNQPIPLLTER